MKFLHEDGSFAELLSIVGDKKGLDASLVEKDYWVTHVLWALQQVGLGLWFKGGTSLSKGFDLLERFSEDLDLKVEPGTCRGIPAVENWKSDSAKHVNARAAYRGALKEKVESTIPGCEVRCDPSADRDLVLDVVYPGRYPAPSFIRPFVRLEIGSARVTPSLPRNIDSWVHAFVRHLGRDRAFRDNRPMLLQCVHPLVTLLEKLEAISKRFGKDPAGYVRHYEDASRIVSSEASLPPLGSSTQDLARQMYGTRDLRRDLRADDQAFQPGSGGAWRDLAAAHALIRSLHWGEQRSLEDCCTLIRAWLTRNPIESP